MNVEDVTGRDLVACMAATLDVAIDAYPTMVVPDDDPASEVFPNEFGIRVVAVKEDRRITDGHATVDVELTDRDGIARTFRLTLTAAELRS